MFQRYTNVGFGNDTGTSNNPLNNGSELSGYSMTYRSEEALVVFNRIESLGLTPNVVSWTPHITTTYKKVVGTFKVQSKKPDLVTWNSLVLGYSMTYRSEEALVVFNRIESLGLTPNVVSWTAMISGCCENENYMDALQFFSQKADTSIWGAVLAACRLHKFIKIAEIAARNLLRLEPYNSANYVLMINLGGENPKCLELDTS
ncbi:hypothetical protein JHK87_000894 [Glycine soja]|nr:hypothetical protein JHK87_000894 [Glycine soja]